MAETMRRILNHARKKGKEEERRRWKMEALKALEKIRR